MTPADLLPPKSEYPLFVPSWRMSGEALDVIAELLCDRRPWSILEMGPGLSSYLFFRYAVRTGRRYAILDHQGEYNRRFINWCGVHGFPVSSMHVRPLAADGYYDVAGVTLPVCDLVSLDGPPRSDARNSAAAHRLLRAVCNPAGATLIVDDSNRESEATLVAWLLQSGFSRERDVPDRRFPRRRTTILSGQFHSRARVL